MNTHLRQRNKRKKIMVEVTEKEENFLNERQKCEKETQRREVREKKDMKKQYGNRAFCLNFRFSSCMQQPT